MTKNENGLRLTGTGSTARRRAIETRRSRSISGKDVTGPITSLSVAARILPAEKAAKETISRVPLQTRNFMDGIRRPTTGNKDTYAQTA